MLRRVACLVLLGVLTVSCQEPPTTSRIGGFTNDGQSAIIHTVDGQSYECEYAKQIEAGGFECWQDTNEPAFWFDEDQVAYIEQVEQ